MPSTWEAKDVVEAESSLPFTNGRENCHCGRRKAHICLGLVTESIIIILSKRLLKFVRSFKKQMLVLIRLVACHLYSLI